jgi:hypothetical protein
LSSQAFLFRQVHPCRQGIGAGGQGADFTVIKLAFEAQADKGTVLPPHLGRAAEGAAVQGYGRPDVQAELAVQPGAAGRKVEDLHGMAHAAGLEEGRHRHGHARMGAAVGVRFALRGRGWACHHVSLGETGVPAGCCQSVNAKNGASMRLTFTRREGKYDDLVIERPGAPPKAIQCPKQGIIPHDMVHFAVERVLAHRGFLGMVAAGEGAGFETQGGDPEESIERLVECFQAEMWGGRVPAGELLATYALACEARGHASAPIAVGEVESIRARLDELTAEWGSVPVNGSLTVEF